MGRRMAGSEACPKCNGEMVQGRLEATSVFVADRAQRPSFWSLDPKVSVSRARVCRACGFIELFLDPQELAKYVKDD